MRRRPGRGALPLVAILSFVVLFSACAGGAAAPTTTTAPAVTAEPSAAEAEHPEASPPTASLPADLMSILEEVARLRDLAPPPTMQVNIVSRDELPALLDSLITDRDRELLRQTTTLYRLLGHFTDNQDYLTLFTIFGVTGILGLYSPPDDALWIVSDEGTTAFEDLTRAEKETLAHELVHALQDYHFAIDEVLATVEDNLDRELAYTALVEGDAVVHEQLYASRFLAIPLAGRLWLVGTYGTWSASIPASFLRELMFPYTTGADWVRVLRAGGGTAAIDAYLESPPSSTAIILHPEQGAAGFEPAEVALPPLAEALGTGWSHESGGTLGEFHLRNYLQLGLLSGAARSAAAGWAGDRYDVYVSGEASLAVFRVRFSSPEEAAEFDDEHRSMLAGRGEREASDGPFELFSLPEGKWAALAERRGSDLLFALGTNEEIVVRALEAMTGS